MRTSIALAAATFLLVAAPAMADDRSSRDRTPDPTLTPPAVVVVPAPGLVSTPSHNSGSISSYTSVSTNSGNNQGGTIVTGDQTSTIHVVNVGPTTQNTQIVTPGQAPPPASQCVGRECPRTR